MTKRSAIMMAAGLAVALLVGIAAISLTMSGTSAAHAERHRKPIVHHRVQTVTIHRKAPSSGGQPVEVVHLGSTSSGGTTSTSVAAGESETGADDVGSDDSADGHGGGSGTGGAYGDD